MIKKNLSGMRFGRLCVVDFSHESKGHAYWNCLCDCGEKRTIAYTNLTSGHSSSCGCSYQHGGHDTRLYGIWEHMIDRCGNPKTDCYRWYGERGIKVCPEWRHDFPAFHSWALSHGYANNLSIDRVDNDGNYEPANCQWITISENTRKMRREVIAKAKRRAS